MTQSNDRARLQSQVHPYLFFEGRADEAIAFYRLALGAEVEMLMRYQDSPEAPPPEKIPADKQTKKKHASLRIGERTLSLSDGHCSGTPNFKGFAITLVMQEVSEVERKFAALAEGGQVVQPLIETFFTPRFGMVVDRFGVMWMLYVPKAM